MYTHVSLFAGLGGFVIAANRNEYRTILASELDKDCAEVLRANFPAVHTDNADVRALTPKTCAAIQTEVDVLSAGFPCQSFSQAGENRGFEDERGKLFFEIPRLCSELPSFPKVLLLENVPFLKLFDGGSRLRTVTNELRKIGYWISEANAQILDSYELGNTPQRRERLFIVAVHSSHFRRNKFVFPGPLEKKKEPLWDAIDRSQQAESRLYLQTDNKYYRMIYKAMQTHGKDRLYQIRRTEVRACPEGVCPTLTANMGGGGHNVPFVIDDYGIRRLTVNEIRRMQCIREGELHFPSGISEASALRMLGNAICIDVADRIFASITEMLEEQG